VTGRPSPSPVPPYYPLMRLAIVTGALFALLIAGCGAGRPGSQAPSRVAESKAFKGSPPALAALHRQGGRLLPSGGGAFKQRLAALRGHPVVVNKWAAWCGPCREEFPVFQKVSVEFGKRVAFLGLDSEDSDSAARKFLGQYPVSYPSYSDPDTKLATSLGAGGAWPTTLILNSKGKIVNTHFGPYTKAADLAADIRRYAE
jgi:cytochrome c biogenesis protein CcmG, thiol:disulfide interchange protein DsbE